MPVSSGRVDRRNRLKRELLDSPGWVSASGSLFSTPQSGFKNSNRRSTLLPDTKFSPRRTRRQTIVMTLPVFEEFEGQQAKQNGDSISKAKQNGDSTSKAKQANGTSNGTSEIQVELMKAPSKRAIRSSAKSKKSNAKTSAKALKSVTEESGTSRRSKAKPSKTATKKTARKRTNSEENGEAEHPGVNGEAEPHDRFEMPLLAENGDEEPASTRRRRRDLGGQGDALLTGTPSVLLDRVDMKRMTSKKMRHEDSPAPEKKEDAEDSLNASNLADTSISPLNASHLANTSGRCCIL